MTIVTPTRPLVSSALIELSCQANQLCQCPQNKLESSLERVNQTVKMLAGETALIPYRKGIEEIQSRLKIIDQQLRQNDAADVALDCYGVFVTINNLFCRSARSQSECPEDLLEAFKKGDSEKVKMLILSRKIDIASSKGRGNIFQQAILEVTKLDDCAKIINTLRTLIRGGAVLNTADDACTPIQEAISHPLLKFKKEVCQLFIECGANVNHTEGEYIRRNGPLPIMMAKYSPCIISNELFLNLIDAGMDVNIRGKNGTLLQETVQRGSETHDNESRWKCWHHRVIFLVAAGADTSGTEQNSIVRKAKQASGNIQKTVFCSPNAVANYINSLKILNQIPKELLGIIDTYSIYPKSEVCKLVLKEYEKS